MPERPLPFKISVLVFVRNTGGKLLLIRRNKSPNMGMWSPIGGKLEMSEGESPYECAIRETREEIGMELAESDLRMFSMISEKSYEGGTHWLMFLFDVKNKRTSPKYFRRLVRAVRPRGDRFAFNSRDRQGFALGRMEEICGKRFCSNARGMRRRRKGRI